MRSPSLRIGLFMLGGMIGMAAVADPASAKIECRGNFQVSKHGLIATPYCEEEQIARVARSYGWKTTAREIHTNPQKKVYTCQVLGHDSRLKGSCAGYGPEAYGAGP
jgi:hypothetical protein